jgi:2-C-methyl-D-erythritol 4-phosphate cytidylyltransferase
MRTVAVVLGGGTGQRIGAALPKQLLRLGGRTLLEHCVAAFEQAPGVDEILVVMAAGYVDQVRAMLAAGGYGAPGGSGASVGSRGGSGGGSGKVTGVIAGGVARSDSTRVALAAITAAVSSAGGDPADCGVLLHDAARPLVDQRIIADCVAALGVHEAAGVAVPASDTIVITGNGVMHSMPRRETLWRCQTPQCFRLPVIVRAHELAVADPDFTSTDDCGVVLRYLPSVDVHIVPGSERNLKITYPQDLALAEALLAEGAPTG